MKIIKKKNPFLVLLKSESKPNLSFCEKLEHIIE